MRLITLIIALFLAGPATAADWKEYAYPDHAFTVHFPVDPTVEIMQEITGKKPAGEVLA